MPRLDGPAAEAPDFFALLSLAVAIAAVLGWLNHRFVRLPTGIGVMLIALCMSLGLLVLDALGLGIAAQVEGWLEGFPLQEAVLDWMLAFLLFAGALHVDLNRLLDHRWVIGILATAGVLASTFLVGTAVWALAGLLGLELEFLHALLFGALISPTDPIAVLGILKSAGVPKRLEVQVAGESLFNDGISVVVFTVLRGLAGMGTAEAEGAGDVARILGVEVLGALLLGVGAGWIVYRMLRSVDSYPLEVLLTLALAMGLYSLATALHASGPLAVVVAGLFIGNTGRRLAMSETTVRHVDTFWELVDEILNVLLFVLVGMEVLLVPFRTERVLAGLVAIPLVLAARAASVAGTIHLLHRPGGVPAHAVKLLTWAGLRGGISIALALSLEHGSARDLILTMTYVVVVFSILVQGLSIGPLARWLTGAADPGPRPGPRG